MAGERSSSGWLWLVGTPTVAIGFFLYYSYAPRFLQRIIENFLYWVNYVVPSSIADALGL